MFSSGRHNQQASYRQKDGPWLRLIPKIKLCRVSPLYKISKFPGKDWVTYILIDSDLFSPWIKHAEWFWHTILLRSPFQRMTISDAELYMYASIVLSTCQLPNTFSTTHRTHPFFFFFSGSLKDSQRGLLAMLHGCIPIGSVRFTFPLRWSSRETGGGGWLPLDALNSSFARSILGGADWEESFITLPLLGGLDCGGAESTAL